MRPTDLDTYEVFAIRYHTTRGGTRTTPASHAAKVSGIYTKTACGSTYVLPMDNDARGWATMMPTCKKCRALAELAAHAPA